MSLDHDLQNLPRLSEKDRTALDDDYSVMPAAIDDDGIARRDAATPGVPMWRDGPAFSVIASELEQIRSVASIACRALRDLDVDGGEEIRLTLMRHVDDPLVLLIDRMSGRDAEVDNE